MKILIVEDDISTRDASSFYLDGIGHEVKAAATPAEARELAAENPPDVLICDWRLGGTEDGADVARDLQSKYESNIIFITAHPLRALRSATRDLQVARYLRKPISLGDLAAALKDVEAA